MVKRYPERAKERRVRNKNYSVSKMTPCVECGFYHPDCMDFHHTDPSNKKDSISRIISTAASIRVLQEEIDKCICLCSNCHRKLLSNSTSPF